jgi:hypothetical protein
MPQPQEPNRTNFKKLDEKNNHKYYTRGRLAMVKIAVRNK